MRPGGGLIYEELWCCSWASLHEEPRPAATGAPMQPTDPELLLGQPALLSPTGAQAAVDEIPADMAGKHSMNRLLQGDVGSGKTAVARLPPSGLASGPYRCSVPLEILAAQHAEV